MLDLFNIRKDFSFETLNESDIVPDPMTMFERWFKEVLSVEILEANTMSLATATPDGKPSSRIVLLKQIKPEGFVFFTNYESKKGQQITENNYCALNFFWNKFERQVRVEGVVTRVSDEESDSYFELRPQNSKLGAWASPQSRVIPSRDYLEQMMADFETEYPDSQIPRPENWGGYIVKPHLIEFWQGRESRLHDRIEYTWENEKWNIKRLAP